MWFCNVVCMNKLGGKGIRNCRKDANGGPAVVEKVDGTTFTVTFGTPKYDFIEALADAGQAAPREGALGYTRRGPRSGLSTT